MLKGFATVTAGLVIAFAGLGSPAHAASHHRGPDGGERASLAFAKKAVGKDWTCHLKWSHATYDVVCAKKAGPHRFSKMVNAATTCSKKPVARRDYSACVSLYMRPSHTSRDGASYTPYGFFLVDECTSQYRGGELHMCLTQPAES
jgi:hypothetical protein